MWILFGGSYNAGIRPGKPSSQIPTQPHLVHKVVKGYNEAK